MSDKNVVFVCPNILAMQQNTYCYARNLSFFYLYVYFIFNQFSHFFYTILEWLNSWDFVCVKQGKYHVGHRATLALSLIQIFTSSIIRRTRDVNLGL